MARNTDYTCRYCDVIITKGPNGWFDNSRDGRDERYARWCIGKTCPDKLHFPCKEDIVKRLLSKI